MRLKVLLRAGPENWNRRIGYRAELKGKRHGRVQPGILASNRVPLPAALRRRGSKQTKLSVTGIDRQKVGQVAAEMRSLRPPDQYKNKGVRYAGERLKKKVERREQNSRQVSVFSRQPNGERLGSD